MPQFLYLSFAHHLVGVDQEGQIYYGGVDHPGDIPQLCLDLVQHVGEVELFVVNLHVGDVPPLVVAHPIGVN